MFSVIILESYLFESLSSAHIDTHVECSSVEPLLNVCVCVCVCVN